MALASSSALLYAPDNWASEETRELHALLCTVYPQYLTLRETVDIMEQLSGLQWKPNQQVLWTGLGPQYKLVDTYARENEMQTLRIAMGPLMNPEHPSCLQKKKTSKAWGRYVRGASLIFAWRIGQGDTTIVLTRPPPTCYNPSRRTTYQEVEEPVMKGLLGFQAVRKIMAAHPTVEKAKGFPPYETWPEDRKDVWMVAFGSHSPKRLKWRKVDPNIPLPKWAVTATAYGFITVSDGVRLVDQFFLLLWACAVLSINLSLSLVAILGYLTYQTLSHTETSHFAETESSKFVQEIERLPLSLPLSSITVQVQGQKAAEICRLAELGSTSLSNTTLKHQRQTKAQGTQTDASGTVSLIGQQPADTDFSPVKKNTKRKKKKALNQNVGVSQGTQTNEVVIHNPLGQQIPTTILKTAKKKKKAAATQNNGLSQETQLGLSTCPGSFPLVDKSEEQQNAKEICLSVMKKAKFSGESPAESSTQALQSSHQVEPRNMQKLAVQTKTKKETKTQQNNVNNVKGKGMTKTPVVVSGESSRASGDAPKLKNDSKEDKAEKPTAKKRKKSKRKEESENLEGKRKGKEKETFDTTGGASTKLPSAKGKQLGNSEGSGAGGSRPRTSAN